MLEELRIQNFAIIDRLELNFSQGFNIITGETGAGKSILIDAVELLLGAKSDVTFIRAGADRALVEGVFALEARTRIIVQPILERESLIEPGDPLDLVTLSRELRSSGRSAARVNGITVNLEVLRELGEALVDIHGQSAHLSLFKPRAHMDLLDRYADLLEVRAALAAVVETLRGLRAEIRVLMDDKAELARRAERLKYEIEEIEAAKLEPDEEGDIEAERSRLANSEQLATLSAEAAALLNGDEAGEISGAVDLLMQAAVLLGKLARIDKHLEDDARLADETSTNAQELSLTLARYVENIEYNPQRLNFLEERIELIRRLKRRFKCESIDEVLAHAERARQELDALENSEERLEELRAKEEKTLRHIGELAQRIHKAREAAAASLSKRIVRELQDLRMERAQFEAVMTQEEAPDGCYIGDKRYHFDSSGIDQIEFMMSANPGEPLRPLAKVASGGEAARIMLALKRVLSQADETPTLIFDEIDQGIGGRIGAVVGEKLWTLTHGHQVLVVTHLAQLAGFGDVHYHVRKSVQGERTQTQVIPLDADERRIAELAAMLGTEGGAGLESARGLLEAARVRKQELLQANGS